MQELLIATRNKKKLKEIEYMLADCGFRVRSLADFKNSPKIVEDGTTFRKNAIKKALTVARSLKKFPCLFDITGFS